MGRRKPLKTKIMAKTKKNKNANLPVGGKPRTTRKPKPQRGNLPQRRG